MGERERQGQRGGELERQKDRQTDVRFRSWEGTGYSGCVPPLKGSRLEVQHFEVEKYVDGLRALSLSVCVCVRVSYRHGYGSCRL